MVILQSALGLATFTAVAFVMSENRSGIRWTFVGCCIGLQFLLAFGAFHLIFLQDVLVALSGVVAALNGIAMKAASFMFGYLSGGPAPFEVVAPEASFLVAFQVLPLILVISAWSAVLYHLGILPFIIRCVARTVGRILNISPALACGAAATLFFGTIEAPLLIKPYLHRLKRAELLALMSCTMTTIAGTVLVLYSTLLEPTVPGVTGHLIIASLVSLPAAIGLSSVVIPLPEINKESETRVPLQSPHSSLLTALMAGISEGLTMVLQIAAVIIVLFACVYLGDEVIAYLFSVLGISAADLSLPTDASIDLQSLLGQLLKPVMWLIGLPWQDCTMAGRLMGTKIVLNEFVAYLDLSQVNATGINKTSRLILTYALCGFANLASTGIITGGLGALMPTRQVEIAELAVKSLVIGNLGSLMTASIVATVLP